MHIGLLGTGNMGGAILKSIAEFIQRKREFELERVRVRVKYGNKYGDVYIFGDTAFC